MESRPRLLEPNEKASPDALWEDVLVISGGRFAKGGLFETPLPPKGRTARRSELYYSVGIVRENSFEVVLENAAGLMADRIAKLEGQVAELHRQLCDIGGRPYSDQKVEPPVSDYLEAVRSIECVSEVLVDEHCERWTIWTLIEAPPFEEELQLPVFREQVNFVRSLPDGASVDFRVLNLCELAEGVTKDEVLPGGLQTLWRRDS